MTIPAGRSGDGSCCCVAATAAAGASGRSHQLHRHGRGRSCQVGTALGIIRNNDKVALNDVDSDEEVTIDIDTLDVRAL